MKKECSGYRLQSIRTWIRLYVIDLVILVVSWGGFYRCTLANADTLFGEISKEATLYARLENYRWMGFIGDGISYALHYYPYEHQKISLGLFLIVMAAALLLTQMTFTHVLRDRLVSAREWLVYIGVTALCYVNVLIAEMFYFTESYLIFKMSMLFAMLGCYLYSRRHYALGTITLLIAPTFYQMSCVQAALVLCTLALLEERGVFSVRLVRKELAYIGVPMGAGLLDYITGPPIASFMSGIVHESLYSAKQISAGSSAHNTWMIAEFRDLYQSSLGLMMPIYLPLLFSLVITAVVLYCVHRQPRVLVTYLVYKVIALLLAVGMQMISGTHAFIPRMMYVFYVMQSMNAIIALYTWIDAFCATAYSISVWAMC